jgi:hypothetical protein
VNRRHVISSTAHGQFSFSFTYGQPSDVSVKGEQGRQEGNYLFVLNLS